MGSRETILKAVRAGKPAYAKVGDIRLPDPAPGNLAETFEASLTKNGGTLHRIDSLSGLGQFLNDTYGADARIASVVNGVKGSVPVTPDTDPHQLSDVDVAVVPGVIGVAENAAVWFTDDRLVQRALPFITQHLVVVLREEDLVPDMHRAYQRIAMGDIRYGVFIAGPSKTADIEQSLVIGAHGPRSHRVMLVTNAASGAPGGGQTNKAAAGIPEHDPQPSATTPETTAING